MYQPFSVNLRILGEIKIYCTYCNKNVLPVCPDCGHPLDARSCPHCGNQIKHEWKTCPVCGEKLSTNDMPIPCRKSDANHINQIKGVGASASGMSKLDLEQVSSHAKAGKESAKRELEALGETLEEENSPEGRNMGKCLLCRHAVHEDVQDWDDYLEGSVLFCPNCDGYVHHNCTKKGWLNDKCPICKNKLVTVEQRYKKLL